MAKFNEILKAKREELHLSIADVSERTRLTERYIIALEERDIHAFEDDLSYLRYFVRAYCDAVGVPFEEVRQDIQEALDEYGQEKEMAMTQTHTDMEQHIQQADALSHVDQTKKDKKKKKRSKWHYNRMNASFLSFIAIVLVILIIVLFAFFILFSRSPSTDVQKDDSLTTTPPVQENQDIGNKDTVNEEEDKTERQEMKIEKTGTASYTVSNVYKDDKLKIKLTPGGSSVLDLLVDGKSVNPEKTIYSYNDPYEYEMTLEKSCKIEVQYGYMYNNKIEINGKELEIDSSIANGSSQVFTIQIEMVE